MKSRHQIDKERHWGLPVPEHFTHGLNTRAKKIYGCDCKACLPSGRRWSEKKVPHKERQARLRARKKGKPVPAGAKHGSYTAKVYGCPCDVCSEAIRAQGRRRRERWRQSAEGHWADGELVRDGFEVTVVHWPPPGDGMWLCPHCNEKFPHRRP